MQGKPGVTYTFVDMILHALNAKLCNFITLWNLTKLPQNFVQCFFSIELTQTEPGTERLRTTLLWKPNLRLSWCELFFKSYIISEKLGNVIWGIDKNLSAFFWECHRNLRQSFRNCLFDVDTGIKKESKISDFVPQLWTTVPIYGEVCITRKRKVNKIRKLFLPKTHFLNTNFWLMLIVMTVYSFHFWLHPEQNCHFSVKTMTDFKSK